MSTIIFHITTQDEWNEQTPTDSFSSQSLKSQGFIHCALIDQILRVANSRLRGKKNLILLCIQEDKLSSKLIYEDLSNLGEDHPHVYGTINKSSISKVVDFPPNTDGSFSLPEELSRL